MNEYRQIIEAAAAINLSRTPKQRRIMKNTPEKFADLCCVPPETLTSFLHSPVKEDLKGSMGWERRLRGH